MYHTINIPLSISSDLVPNVDMEYAFNVLENLNDITQYLFEEEYGIKYQYSTWYLQDGAREFVKNLETLWNTKSLDAFTLYTKDLKFIEWLKEKYYEDAKEQYLIENIVYYDYDSDEEDENILNLYE